MTLPLESVNTSRPAARYEAGMVLVMVKSSPVIRAGAGGAGRDVRWEDQQRHRVGTGGVEGGEAGGGHQVLAGDPHAQLDHLGFGAPADAADHLLDLHEVEGSFRRGRERAEGGEDE